MEECEMGKIGWIIVSVGAAIPIGIIGIWRMLRGKRSGFPLQEERTINQELTTLASSLIVLGIVFGTDRLISYSLIGAGVLVSILYWIRSKNRGESH